MGKTIEFTYEGKKYLRYNDTWVDTHYMLVPDSLGLILEKRWKSEMANARPFDKTPIKDLLASGDWFKAHADYSLAARHYEEIIRRGNQRVRSIVYARLTSCYRKLGRPRDVVELLSRIKKEDGIEAITPVLLTSVAAAYCDLHEYQNALTCARRAYAMEDGKPSDALRNVLSRIESEIMDG